MAWIIAKGQTGQGKLKDQKKTTKNISHEELPRWGMGGGDHPTRDLAWVVMIPYKISHEWWRCHRRFNLMVKIFEKIVKTM